MTLLKSEFWASHCDHPTFITLHSRIRSNANRCSLSESILPQLQLATTDGSHCTTCKMSPCPQVSSITNSSSHVKMSSAAWKKKLNQTQTFKLFKPGALSQTMNGRLNRTFVLTGENTPSSPQNPYGVFPLLPSPAHSVWSSLRRFWTDNITQKKWPATHDFAKELFTFTNIEQNLLDCDYNRQ